MTTTVSFVVFLFSIAAIPGSLLAKGKMTASDAQPPEIKIMPSANQLPEIILAVNPSMPLGPKDLREGYEDEMKAVSGRFANELSSISHAADENQMSGQQAEETSKERFQVAMMQFQLLVALRANLEREIDRAEQTAQGAPRPSQQDVSAVGFAARPSWEPLLVHDNFATFRGFFHQEGYGSHAQTSEREERNDVEIRKQAGLLLDSLIDLRQGLMTSVLLGDRLAHKPEASTGINSAAIVFAYLPRSKYAFPCI